MLSIDVVRLFIILTVRKIDVKSIDESISCGADEYIHRNRKSKHEFETRGTNLSFINRIHSLVTFSFSFT